MYPRPEDDAAVTAALIPQGDTSFPIPIRSANAMAVTAINGIGPYEGNRTPASRKPLARITPISNTGLSVTKGLCILYFP